MALSLLGDSQYICDRILEGICCRFGETLGSLTSYEVPTVQQSRSNQDSSELHEMQTYLLWEPL
jgi:hypothetical protein